MLGSSLSHSAERSVSTESAQHCSESEKAGDRGNRGWTAARYRDDAHRTHEEEAGESAIERLTAWEQKVVQVEFETYEDEDNLPGKLVKHTRHLLDVIDHAGPPIAAGALERLADLEAEWAQLEAELAAIEASDITAVNNWAWENAVPHVSTRDQ